MLRPMKVLVVDDDPDFLDSTKTMRESNSYQVAVALREQEALAEIDAERPDLLILDVMMSSLESGFRFMWKLKADDRYKTIPILIVTGVGKKLHISFAQHVYPGRRDPDEEAYLPVEDYVVKPVTTSKLLSSVKRTLERAGKQAVSR